MIHYLSIPKAGMKYADRESAVISLFLRDPKNILIVPTEVEKDLISEKVPSSKKREIYHYTDFPLLRGKVIHDIIIDQVDMIPFFEMSRMVEMGTAMQQVNGSYSNIYLIFSNLGGTFP